MSGTTPTTRTDDPPAPPVRLTFFMLVRATPAWLALAPDERFAFADGLLVPLLAAHPQVALRFYDTEAFTSRVSDVMVWETADLATYQAVVEGLRESPFWGTYFEVVEILPGIENAYARHYGRAPYGARRRDG